MLHWCPGRESSVSLRVSRVKCCYLARADGTFSVRSWPQEHSWRPSLVTRLFCASQIFNFQNYIAFFWQDEVVSFLILLRLSPDPSPNFQKNYSRSFANVSNLPAHLLLHSFSFQLFSKIFYLYAISCFNLMAKISDPPEFSVNKIHPSRRMVTCWFCIVSVRSRQLRSS